MVNPHWNVHCVTRVISSGSWTPIPRVHPVSLCNAHCSHRSALILQQSLIHLLACFVSLEHCGHIKAELGWQCVQEAATINKQLASVALGQFKSCVRTSLLLCDGYECQEHDGTFVVAFSSPRAALEWALILQLALLR